jgi:hypothetical protein
MKILKYNESWFKKDKVEELKPMGVITTVPRKEEAPNRLSPEELNKIKDDFSKKKIEDPRIDVYFIQEVSDRLYGPDSDDYIEALKELNKKYRPRRGRTGHDIFKGEI